MFLAASLRLLFSQFAHLLLDVADLSLQTLVLLLFSVLAAAALVSLLHQLLKVLLKTGDEALRRDGEMFNELVDTTAKFKIMLHLQFHYRTAEPKGLN